MRRKSLLEVSRRNCTNCGDGGDHLSKLEFVQYRRFSSRIKSDHQNPHLLLGEEPAKKPRKSKPHRFHH